MYVLIVEDEKSLADSLGEMMRGSHYAYDIVYNGEDGLSYAESGLYDVILLDILLPKIDGLTVLKRLREKKIETPVILLSALSDTTHKVRGLDCGADDYIAKPFSKDELFARIRANSRRHGEVVLDTLKFGDLTLNLSDGMLSCGKKSIWLAYKEFAICKLLAGSPGKIFPKAEVFTKVWGYLSESESNSVEVYISFLRKKLAFLQTRVYIETVRKMGYRLVDPEERKQV